MSPRVSISRDWLDAKFSAISQQLVEMGNEHKEHLQQDRIDFDNLSKMILALDRDKAVIHAALDKRLDRLEVVQASRVRHFGYVWAAIGGIAATVIGIVFGK